LSKNFFGKKWVYASMRMGVFSLLWGGF
jgi:hypothetical protein